MASFSENSELLLNDLVLLLNFIMLTYIRLYFECMVNFIHEYIYIYIYIYIYVFIINI